MKYWQIVLITFIPLLIVSIIVIILYSKKISNSKNQRDADNNEEVLNSNFSNKSRILKFPAPYKIIFLSVIVFCLCIAIYTVIFQCEDWPYLLILFGFFGIPALIIFVCWSLWKVEIHNSYFIYRNYLGKKKVYRYSDLEYKEHQKGLKWYFYKDGKRVLCMPYYIEGENKLYKAYKKNRLKNK